jgi:hypothetical protein
MIKVSLSSADRLAIHNKYVWELREVRMGKMRMEGVNTYDGRRNRPLTYSRADFSTVREKREDILRRRHEELEPEPKHTIFRGELI